MRQIKVILADDHVIVRNGIKSLLEDDSDIVVVGEASDGQEALNKVSALQPDILITDIRMPGMNGIEATRQLPTYSDTTKSLVLSMHDNEDYVLQSLDSGAHGYLLKDCGKDEFLKAIRTIMSGEKYFSGAVSAILANSYLNKKGQGEKSALAKFDLTKREKQVLGLIVSGNSNKDIADELGKSVRTIEAHRFNIMKKLEVKNAVELVTKALEEKLLA